MTEAEKATVNKVQQDNEEAQLDEDVLMENCDGNKEMNAKDQEMMEVSRTGKKEETGLD